MKCETAHAAARCIPDLNASAEFRAIVQLTAQEETKRIYASRVNESVAKASEEALSQAFQISYESANVELENTSYHFVKSVLTEMAHKGALDEVFDQYLE